MAKLKIPVVLNSKMMKEVVQKVTASAEFKDSVPEDYKKGFFDFAETLINTLEKIGGNDTDAETPCDRCKHFLKKDTQYPCKFCRNCYTSKFELDEGKVGNG
jgi:Zn finger protein HypA/HybF involved in hydrogenase expression